MHSAFADVPSFMPASLAQWNKPFEMAATYNRAVIEDFSRYMREESLRFLKQRMERTGVALEKLSNCQDMKAAIGIHQEWLNDLVEDMTAQGMRNTEKFRTISADALEASKKTAGAAQDAAAETADKAHDMAQGAVDQAQDAANSQTWSNNPVH